jgi:dTDP-D-glucose 4,6-dehydratase
MKILVTGGAGFIGSSFIRYILGIGKGYKVVNYDKLTYAGDRASVFSVAGNPNYRFIRGDICDAAAVESARKGCEAIVAGENLCGDFGQCAENPTLDGADRHVAGEILTVEV